MGNMLINDNPGNCLVQVHKLFA